MLPVSPRADRARAHGSFIEATLITIAVPVMASLPARLRAATAGHGTLVRFSLASSASSFTGMVAGLVIIAWIAPTELGVWKSLLIIQSYAGIVQAGVVHGLNRELPFRVGAGSGGVSELAATAQVYTLIGVCALFAASIVSFFISHDPLIRYALPVVFLISAAGIYVNYLAVTFRADQAFERLAKIYLAISVLNIATMPVVYYMGYYGMVMRLLIIALFQIGAMYAVRPIRVSLAFSRRSFVILIRTGLPLFMFGYMISISITFPNTILLMEGGVEWVGIFAPALAVLGVMNLLSSSIAQYVYAKMSFRLGQTGDPKDIWTYAWKSSLGLLAISVPIVLGVMMTYPWLVRAFYPKYAESIGSVVWIAIAGAFFGAQQFSSALNSMKAWPWIATYTLAFVGLSFLLPFAGSHISGVSPMIGVAAGYALVGIVLFAIGLFCTYRATHPRGAPLLDLISK